MGEFPLPNLIARGSNMQYFFKGPFPKACRPTETICCWSKEVFPNQICWWLVWNMNFMTSHHIGMSSFPLTFIFFRGVGQPPTSCTMRIRYYFWTPETCITMVYPQPVSSSCPTFEGPFRSERYTRPGKHTKSNIENGHRKKYPWKIVIFHSYVAVYQRVFSIPISC